MSSPNVMEILKYLGDTIISTKGRVAFALAAGMLGYRLGFQLVLDNPAGFLAGTFLLSQLIRLTFDGFEWTKKCIANSYRIRKTRLNSEEKVRQGMQKLSADEVGLLKHLVGTGARTGKKVETPTLIQKWTELERIGFIKVHDLGEANIYGGRTLKWELSDDAHSFFSDTAKREKIFPSSSP